MTHLSPRRRCQPVALAALATVLALPLAASAQKSLGGGGGSGPIMTRDELRTCLKQQAELKVRVAEFERNREALAKEKDAILQTKSAIDAERGGVQADAAKINDINARTEAVAKRIDDWNVRWQAFEKEGRSGPIADRQRRQLLNEQRDLQEANAALEKERTALGGVGAGANEVNAKVESLNARTVAWNENNKRMVALNETLTQERALWADECGSRRFLEEDEAAIKAGK